MKKQNIKNTALASLFTSLIVVLLLLGTLFELLDIMVAAICSFLVSVIMIETSKKHAYLVYFASGILSLIFVPISSAVLYFVGFFGFYPMLNSSANRLSKIKSKVLKITVFNICVILLLLLFKTVFAMQNEPAAIWITLIILYNVFFISFDILHKSFPQIYLKLIKPKFNINHR